MTNIPKKTTRARHFRVNETPAEKLLWQSLRNRKLGGFKFRRQHPIGKFIVDFYCDQACLIIELDGDIHLAHKEYDAARDQWLKDNDYTVLRFKNQQVIQSQPEILRMILKSCQNTKYPK